MPPLESFRPGPGEPPARASAVVFTGKISSAMYRKLLLLTLSVLIVAAVAVLASSLHDVHFAPGKPVSRTSTVSAALAASGVDAEALKKQLAAGKGDTEILEWVGKNGKHKRTDAEIAALQKAGERACGADLYLTLEPCVHFGRTPPCAPAILAAGPRRVIVAARDPNPLVAGRGLSILSRAGIEVLQTDPVRRCRAERQNEKFRLWATTR